MSVAPAVAQGATVRWSSHEFGLLRRRRRAGVVLGIVYVEASTMTGPSRRGGQGWRRLPGSVLCETPP
jgi:hypothetical protein